MINFLWDEEDKEEEEEDDEEKTQDLNLVWDEKIELIWFQRDGFGGKVGKKMKWGVNFLSKVLKFLAGPMMLNSISYLLDLEWVSTDSSGFFFFLFAIL